MATEIMNKFKWGHTFLELNSDLLQEYSAADTAEQAAIIEREYFPQLG
jgi:pre-rRNA-processing protein TSR3